MDNVQLVDLPTLLFDCKNTLLGFIREHSQTFAIAKSGNFCTA